MLHVPKSKVLKLSTLSAVLILTLTPRDTIIYATRKKTNATTQCNNYHVTEHPHVPIRPCSSSFWDKRAESLSISNIDFR